jgi:hypothetical protein
VTCDPAAVAALVERLARTAEDRVVTAAAGWAGLCTGDAVVDGQMSQITPAGRDRWWLVELQVGVVDARRWTDACTGGTQALSMATKLGGTQRRPHLWASCGLARYGAFAEGEWATAEGLLVLPILAAHTLQAGGVAPAQARPIVRALAGL